MAQKQDQPKKLMVPKKEGMPKRRNTLVKIDRVVVKPKPKTGLPKTGLLKKALAQGDQSSASSSFTARAARKIATGAGKALKSMAAKPNTVKIDSVKKVNPIGGSKPSIIIKKETKIRRPTIGGAIPFPVRPEKKAIIIKKMMK